MFKFRYSGGVKKPSQHTTEKFLAFFLVGGEEIPFYEMEKSALVQPDPTAVFDDLQPSEQKAILNGKMTKQQLTFLTRNHYTSVHPIVKVMLYTSGFGTATRRKIFFIRLEERGLTGVKISPFTPDLGFVFEAEHARVMGDTEVRPMLQKGSISRMILGQSDLLPKAVMDSILTVTILEPETAKPVRKLKV